MNIWIMIYRRRGSQQPNVYVPYPLRVKLLTRPVISEIMKDIEIIDIIQRTYDESLFNMLQ